MNPRAEYTIRAYLLRRLSESDARLFESRLLDDRELLKRVRDTEQAMLEGRLPPDARHACRRCFVSGAILGALLPIMIGTFVLEL